MKTKNLFFSLSFTFLCFTTILFNSCKQGNENNATLSGDNIPYNQLYKDSVFLEIEGDLYDPAVIWGNVETYMAAYNRMKCHLKLTNNQLNWDFISGKELNISENIFKYVTDIWKRENQQVRSKNFKLIYKEGDYLIVPNKTYESSSKPITRSSTPLGKGRPGDEERNFEILSMFCDDSYIGENLGNLVTLDDSNFTGNGVGDVSISGSFIKNERIICTYYCCNACAWDKYDKKTCHQNDIRIPDCDIQLNGKITFRWMRNSARLPLISIKEEIFNSEH